LDLSGGDGDGDNMMGMGRMILGWRWYGKN